MDQKAFEILVRQIRTHVLHEAIRFLEDIDEAEDITQDVLLKLWYMRERLGEYRSVEALAIVMARNLALNRRRVMSRMVRDGYGNDMTDGQTPDQEMMHSEEERQVAMLIQSLPSVQQLTLRMKHLEGMEIGEIAAMIGATENAVRVNLSRARKKILDYFINEGIRR